MNRGILYLSFGEKASKAVANSYASIKATASAPIPATAWGTHPVSGLNFINWRRPLPHNKKGLFVGSLVTPYFYDALPYDQTLYLDADTTALADILPGFAFLDGADIALATHYNNLTIEDCHAGAERDETIKMVGENVPLINGGVRFLRKNEAIRHLFQVEYREWERFRERDGLYDWDPQPAIHRALHLCPEVRVVIIPEKWNQKFKQDDTIIWHQMGQEIAGKRWK